MTLESGTAANRRQAKAQERAERLEILASIARQGFGDCPNWIVMELEDCERADCPPPGRRGRAMKE